MVGSVSKEKKTLLSKKFLHMIFIHYSNLISPTQMLPYQSRHKKPPPGANDTVRNQVRVESNLKLKGEKVLSSDLGQIRVRTLRVCFKKNYIITTQLIRYCWVQ